MAALTSCITHQPQTRLVIIREDYLRICEGNHCAAALLNFFEHGHNIKLAHRHDAEHANEVAERHGDRGSQDMTLLQWHTQEQIEEGLLGLYKRMIIRNSLQLLLKHGFISVHKNPNPRYHFDQTHYFLFHPEVIQPQVLDISDQPKMAHAGEENGSWSAKNGSTRSLIPSEITSQIFPPSPSESSPQGGKRRRTREGLSHFVPEDFVVTPPLEAWAHEQCPQVDIAAQTRLFRNHEFDKPRSDWPKTWMNWMLQSLAYTRRNGTAKTPQDRAPEYAELVRTIEREEAANGHQ